MAWIVGTHYDPERDIQFTRGPVDDLEDASDLPAYGSKMGIDATRKWTSEGFTRPWPKKIATSARGGAHSGRAMGTNQAGVEIVSGLQRLAERLASGASITDGDVGMLLESRDLIAIGSLADEMRRRLHGARTSFVRVFEVRVDALPDSLPGSLTAGEIRLVGDAASLANAEAAVTAARRLAGDVPLSGFSLGDLVRWDVPLEDAPPGCGMRASVSLPKCPSMSIDDPAQWLPFVRAGLLAYRLTVHTYGEEPFTLQIVNRAGDFQKAVGGFRAFAPLPRVVSPVTPTTGYDDVKLVAVSRLLVPDIPSIQVDWPLYGPKLAQVALTMGADDVDGIAAFEPTRPGHAPQRRWRKSPATSALRRSSPSSETECSNP